MNFGSGGFGQTGSFGFGVNKPANSFGGTTTAPFGSTQSNAGGFGITQPAASVFGAPQQQPAGAFGNNQSSFGSPGNFGAAPGLGSGFGGAGTGAFGGTNNNAFGGNAFGIKAATPPQSNSTGFMQSQGTPGFGGFGNAVNASPGNFGSTGFGSTTPQVGFGASGFGGTGNSTGFGTTNTAGFGGANTTTTFGGPTNTGFGATGTGAVGGAFGGTSAFGTTTAAPTNPFGSSFGTSGGGGFGQPQQVSFTLGYCFCFIVICCRTIYWAVETLCHSVPLKIRNLRLILTLVLVLFHLEVSSLQILLEIQALVVELVCKVQELTALAIRHLSLLK